MQKRTLKQVYGLLGCIGFVVIGVYAVNQRQLYSVIVGSVAILFFGLGVIAIVWGLLKKKPDLPTEITLVPAESIVVQRVENPDEEVLEEWIRAGNLADKDLQSVAAVKYDWQDFPWAVDFGAPCYIREDPFALKLEQALTQALLQVPGVKQAIREDTEKWAVDGNPCGEALVRGGSVAVDKFLCRYREQWLHSMENLPEQD